MSETFEEWCYSTGMDDARVVPNDMVSMETLYECWNHQQKKIDELEQKLQAAEENLTECASNYWKEVEKRKAAEEEIFLLRMIAYTYKNLDCHSSPEAIEAITVKGWQAQLNYEKWWLNNKGDVHFKDWKELEQALEKVRKE